jgi:hypothetical protein
LPVEKGFHRTEEVAVAFKLFTLTLIRFSSL